MRGVKLTEMVHEMNLVNITPEIDFSDIRIKQWHHYAPQFHKSPQGDAFKPSGL